MDEGTYCDPARSANRDFVVDRDDERVGVNSCRGVLRGENSSVDADIGLDTRDDDVGVWLLLRQGSPLTETASPCIWC